jgi:hypothetical protein
MSWHIAAREHFQSSRRKSAARRHSRQEKNWAKRAGFGTTSCAFKVAWTICGVESGCSCSIRSSGGEQSCREVCGKMSIGPLVSTRVFATTCTATAHHLWPSPALSSHGRRPFPSHSGFPNLVKATHRGPLGSVTYLVHPDAAGAWPCARLFRPWQFKILATRPEWLQKRIKGPVLRLCLLHSSQVSPTHNSHSTFHGHSS